MRLSNKANNSCHKCTEECSLFAFGVLPRPLTLSLPWPLVSSCEFMFVSAKDGVVAKATLEQIKSCGYARNVLRWSRLAGLLSCVNSTLLTGSSYVGFQ